MNTLRIASTIRDYRRTHHMSQTAFGEHLGVSAQAVSKWERERCCPDITLLPSLAKLLGVTVAYLVGEDA